MDLRPAEGLSSASRARPVASGTSWPYRSTVVVIDLWPSQREASEIGTPSAKLVESNIPTERNTSARTERAAAIPLVRDFCFWLVQPRTCSSRLRRRGST
jgi:hypothetical protein